MKQSILETRIDALESKVTFQDDTIEQLNSALVHQQSRIDRLETRVTVLQKQLEAQGTDAADELGEMPPPHY